MDALRRAEEEKKQQADAVADTPKGTELAAEADGDRTTEVDIAAVQASIAGPEDVTMHVESPLIEPAAPAEEAASTTATMEAEDLGLEIAAGDLSGGFARPLSGDDSSAFDLADDGLAAADGEDKGLSLDGDHSRSMSLPGGLALEPIEDDAASEDGSSTDGYPGLGDDVLGLEDTGADSQAVTIGGSTTAAGQPRGRDQTSTLPSTRALESDLNDYFDRSRSMEAPRGALQADQTLDDVAAHTVVGAQTVFDAGRRPRTNRLLIGIAVVAIVVVLGIGVVALFYAQQRPEPRPIPPPTVAAGVERAPVRELPVVPAVPVQPPAAAPAEDALPRIDIERSPEVVAATRVDSTAPRVPGVMPDTAADAPMDAVGDRDGAVAAAEPMSDPAPMAHEESVATPPGDDASMAASVAETMTPASMDNASLATATDTGGTVDDSATDIPVSSRDSPAIAASAGADIGIAAGEVRIARSVTPAAVDARIESAYAAYQAGRLDQAEGHYRAALADNPDARDALLGLGAVALAAGRFEAAYNNYAAVLERHPGDAVATAALIDLTGGADERQVARLRLALDNQDDNPYLHFTLGNWYARQGRWSDAQQAYFEAYTRDESNPDYAYNLAVSLDRLYQAATAVTYYQRALELTETTPGRFETSNALSRIQALSSAADE